MQSSYVTGLHALPKQGGGMDVIIVSVETPQQEAYWEPKLRAGRGKILKAGARICCVHEDWPGGAGNGLGTLYAFVKAQEKMLRLENIDLYESLQQGASIAIYHTAGMGKRLYPLTASEGGNKSAVKLPSLVDEGHYLSILEAAIKQTGAFASCRKGRVSVFWGDQVFIPSETIETRSKAHIDILALVGKFPSEEVWEQKKMSTYGLIAIDRDGVAKDLDKCDYRSVVRLAGTRQVAFEGGAGISMGCFSLSYDILLALISEFSTELANKNVKMDSDPYIWMPLTLERETYLEAMSSKGEAMEGLSDHYKRMQDFKHRFMKVNEGALFGAVNLGEKSFWWDYGTVQSYIDNNLKICKNDEEAVVMRAFLNIDKPVAHSHIRLSRIHNSVVVGVNADQLRIANTVVINSNVFSLEGDRCLMYNVREEAPMVCVSGTVRADVFLSNPAMHIKMITDQARDGKQDWTERLPGNPYSYEELQHLMHSDKEHV